MQSRLPILLVLVAALGLGAAPQTPVKPLTKDQVMELVKGSVNSEHVANLIRERGIDFDPTEEYFQALRDAGAEQVLIDAFASARTIKPPAPDPAALARQHVKGAYALIGTGDTDGAIALCQKAIQENPGDAEAHRVLGIAYGKKKDWPRDIAEQRAAILLNPDDAAAKAELTFALHSAEPELTHTVDPGSANAVKAQVQVEDSGEQARKAFADGQLQATQRKFEAAAISFSEAAQLKPDWADPLVERAKVYMKLYLFQEAIHSYDQAIQLKANDPVTLNLRGYAYYSASQFPQAIRDFDEAIQLDPSRAEAFKNRGNAKWQMGDKVGANADFEQAKALESGTYGQKKAKRR
jgi:tetratricopeptide (TPR) repeat protein